MKPLKIILIIVLLLTVTISISAFGALSFYSGNEYLQFSEKVKMAYVAGFSDMSNILIEYYEPEKYQKIIELTKDMTIGQTVKILDKYLEENPEKLHISAAVLFLNAIDEIIYQK